MWRSLSVARGDLVMFMDADTRDFEPQLVYGILGPILEDPTVRYVKAAYRRPFKSAETLQVDGGGRVTELSTKPLFNLLDRKSTRLNSSHATISYAVFCLTKKRSDSSLPSP